MSMNCTTAPPPDLDERRFVTNRVVTIVGCLTLVAAPFVWTASVGDDGPILCGLRAATGLPCPGCGLTRAFCALSQFDVWQAVQFNAISLPLLLLVVVAPVVALYELGQGRRCQWYRFVYSVRL